MYAFIRLDRKERAQAFQIASEKSGHPAYVIEKDLWVTYMLDTLFNRIELDHHILFKGGTSLSKCYGLIDRFSEDIDLSLHMGGLGFSGDRAPHIVADKESKSAGKRAVDELRKAGEELLEKTLYPLLFEKIKKDLAADDSWELLIDKTNREDLLFHYPRSLSDGEYGDLYVKPVVLIETGTKSAHEPIEQVGITSFLEDVISEIHTACMVNVLSPRRTFWEKVTILHAENNINRPERVKERLSRHLYDLVMFYRSPIGKEAMKDLDILEDVAKHKAFYFRSNSAKYDEARPGTLRLVPEGEILAAFRSDYEKMRSMFPGGPIPFSTILEELRSLEVKLNHSDESPEV